MTICCCDNQTEVDEPERASQFEGFSLPSRTITFTIAALVPYCVLELIEEGYLNHIPLAVNYTAVVMVCEIRGLRELTDAYSLSNNYTADNLDEELNKVLTSVIGRFVSEGGDVLTYVGNIVTCLWKVREGVDPSEMMIKALEAALFVQKTFDCWKTKIGIILKITFGISFGNVQLLCLGDASEQIHYIATGEEIVNSLVAKSQCPSGQIVLSANAWKLVPYESKKYIWRNLESDFVLVYRKSVNCLRPGNTQEAIETNMILLEDHSSKFAEEIKPFIHPVFRVASSGRQLSMFDSLSQITVVIVTVLSVDPTSLDDVQLVTVTVQKNCKEFGGILIGLLYDKRLLFSITFGTPGYKHHNDSVNAIKCCQKIVKTLRDFDITVTTSVATSTTYCGTLGPPCRLIYAPIGASVNDSLDIQANYRDFDIVCCSGTYFRAWREIGGDFFIPLRKRSTKVKSAAVLYHFDCTRTKSDKVVKFVGRTEERSLLTKALNELRRNSDNLGSKLPLVVIKGGIGSGRTQVAKWVLSKAEEFGFTLNSFASCYDRHEKLVSEPYGSAWQITKGILKSKRINSEAKLLEFLASDAKTYPLRLLNACLENEFHPLCVDSDEELEQMRNLMIVLIQKCRVENHILIVVDDADTMENESWSFLRDILIVRAACVVITFNENVTPTVPFIINMFRQQYAEIVLGPLSNEDIVSLVCLFLNVQAVHKCFLDFLFKHSSGNPLKLEEILQLAQLQQHLCVVPFKGITAPTFSENFVCPTENNSANLGEMKACDILGKEGLEAVFVPENLSNLVELHTNGLNAEEMMVAKKCACMGETFDFVVLEAACLEHNTSDELFYIIYRLAQKNILQCKCNHLVRRSTSSSRVEGSSCGFFTLTNEICSHTLRFSSERVRACIYNTMTPRQKENLHELLADILKNTKLKCDACRRESQSETVPQFKGYFSAFLMPRIDLRFCQCLQIKVSIYNQIEWQLRNCNAPIERRLHYLFKAVESSLDANNKSVSKLLSIAKHLCEGLSHTQNGSVPNITLERLQAEYKILIGNYKEALEHVKQACLHFGTVFPGYYERELAIRRRRSSLNSFEEEVKCLFTGTKVLYLTENYDLAYKIGRIQLRMLQSARFDFSQQMYAKCLMLLVGSKTKKSRYRTKKWAGEIMKACQSRLNVPPVVDTLDLMSIFKVLCSVVIALFENNYLEKAAVIGINAFQMMKELHSQETLWLMLPSLILVFYYQNKYMKCSEMVAHLQGEYQQSGDFLPEALYHGILAKILICRVLENTADKIKMCNEFAIGRCNTPLPAQNAHMTVYITSTMALWCFINDLEEQFEIWYNRATSLQPVTANSYWTIAAAIAMLYIECYIIKRRANVLELSEIRKMKAKVEKNVSLISTQMKLYVPVLKSEMTVLEKSVAHCWTECKQTISQ